MKATHENELGIPVPRLELRWKKVGGSWVKRKCFYEIVMPLGEYDIRRELENGTKQNVLRVNIGETLVEGGGTEENAYPVKNGVVDIPFRDGVHAKLDADNLGLQVWATCDGEKTKIYPCPTKNMGST